MICSDCGSEVHPFSEKCHTCGWFAGFPNVRAADDPVEVDALDSRYRAACAAAADEGRFTELQEFEGRLADSFAVISTQLEVLRAFLTSSSTLYTTYSFGVKGQLRKPADPDDDRERRMVEAKLFGAYAEEIRYAALSIDGAGVSSYGPFAIRLRDVSVAKRASLLEENSYDFFDHHGLSPKNSIPPGYRCSWRNRQRLGVAKLGKEVQPTMCEADFARLILQSDGSRADDRFIEIHIYGAFDASAIESVQGSTTSKTKQDRADLARVRELLAKRGCRWVENA